MLNSHLLKSPILLIRKEILPNIWLRNIITGNPNLCEVNEEIESQSVTKDDPQTDVKYRKKKIYPIEVCLRYMESDAYKTTYGDKPVWHTYIRNFKGGIPPDTRLTCLDLKGKLRTGSPCPICRDEYLLPHYLNVKLLEQFISPYGGHLIETKKTGVCQVQQFNLKIAIRKAQNYGLLKFPVPHRHYDYSVYNKK